MPPRNTRKRSAPEIPLPAVLVQPEKKSKTTTQVSSYFQTLRKLNHPDILLAYIEKDKNVADHRKNNTSARLGFEKNCLFKLIRADNCILITHIPTLYHYESVKFRQQQKANAYFLLKKLADRFFAGDVQATLEAIPTASESETKTILNCFNAKFKANLTSVDSSIHYLETLHQVTLPSTTPITASFILPRQYNALRKLNNPQYGMGFILNNTDEANFLRSNLNKRLALVTYGITLYKKGHCVFIKSTDTHKSQKKVISLFLQAVLARINEFHPEQKASLSKIRLAIIDATPDEEITFQACYNPKSLSSNTVNLSPSEDAVQEIQVEAVPTISQHEDVAAIIDDGSSQVSENDFMDDFPSVTAAPSIAILTAMHEAMLRELEEELKADFGMLTAAPSIVVPTAIHETMLQEFEEDLMQDFPTHTPDPSIELVPTPLVFANDLPEFNMDIDMEPHQNSPSILIPNNDAPASDENYPRFWSGCYSPTFFQTNVVSSQNTIEKKYCDNVKTQIK